MQTISPPWKTEWHLALLLSYIIVNGIRSCLIGIFLPFLHCLPQTSTKVYELCFPMQKPSPALVASIQWCWHHGLSCTCLAYPFFPHWTLLSQIPPSPPEPQLCPLLPSWCGMPVFPCDLQAPFGLSQGYAEAPESQGIWLLHIVVPDLSCTPCCWLRFFLFTSSRHCITVTWLE